jgi:hypothetical protein
LSRSRAHYCEKFEPLLDARAALARLHIGQRCRGKYDGKANGSHHASLASQQNSAYAARIRLLTGRTNLHANRPCQSSRGLIPSETGWLSSDIRAKPAVETLRM